MVNARAISGNAHDVISVRDPCCNVISPKDIVLRTHYHTPRNAIHNTIADYMVMQGLTTTRDCDRKVIYSLYLGGPVHNFLNNSPSRGEHQHGLARKA